MRPLVVSVSCLFLLGIGCNSSDKDPEAAARAAQSAAGSLTKPPVKKTMDEDGPVIGGGKQPHLPGGMPDDRKPPPSVGTATCITDDGDDPSDHDPDPDDQEGPGGFKNPGPIVDLDPAKPKVEEAVPKSAKSGGPKAKSGGPGMGKGAKPVKAGPGVGKGAKGTKGVARSATSGPTSTKANGLRVDWGTICASRMDADACNDLCGSKGLRWDSTAGASGTCFESAPASSSSTGSSVSTVECGCMCLPGS